LGAAEDFALALPTTALRRPGRGLRAPAIASLTWELQRSFTKFPRATLIVIVSAAGRPQVSHTKIVFSAMMGSLRARLWEGYVAADIERRFSAQRR
jgi:hypothetical protein